MTFGINLQLMIDVTYSTLLKLRHQFLFKFITERYILVQKIKLDINVYVCLLSQYVSQQYKNLVASIENILDIIIIIMMIIHTKVIQMMCLDQGLIKISLFSLVLRHTSTI
jgi:hypothetical protein